MSYIEITPGLQFDKPDLHRTRCEAGFVYLMHFDRPLAHAQHYIGFTTDLNKRFTRHAKGHGARIVAAALRQGIKVTIVRIWKADRHYERQLKNRKKARCLCPLCNVK